MICHKVLIIDDDLVRCEKIKGEILKRFKSLEVEISDSVNSAKINLRKNHYFAVLLDMALPLRSGEKEINPKAGINILDELRRG